jgi:hypothetical protein
MLKKTKSYAFGKDTFLLGVDSDGVYYWLEAAKFDCSWYWGFGYVETYTNNKNPKLSRDINSHQHFDGLFFNKNKNKNGFDAFKDFFVETPFTDSEIWRICELMKSFYIARQYSDMIYRGGAHYTSNPAKETIKNESEYNRINTVVIPEILNKLYNILGGDEN